MADTPTHLPTHAAAAPARTSSAPRITDWRLHKHADYQCVYKSSRKQFSSLMVYFAAPRSPEPVALAGKGPRIGLTAGRVLGNAVERNRIKRRMRAAIRQHLPLLTKDLDLVLHPKRAVLDADFAALTAEVERIFRKLESAGKPTGGALPTSARGHRQHG